MVLILITLFSVLGSICSVGLAALLLEYTPVRFLPCLPPVCEGHGQYTRKVRSA